VPHLKLDDGFPDHPKVWSLSDAAFRLHTSGLAFCNRLRTDGFVPADQVARLVPHFRRKTLDELLESDRWAAVGVTRVVSYEIRNYLEWNDSAEEIEKKRLEAEERRRRYRERHAND
jgi:hypothetical protein